MEIPSSDGRAGTLLAAPISCDQSCGRTVSTAKRRMSPARAALNTPLAAARVSGTFVVVVSPAPRYCKPSWRPRSPILLEIICV